MSTPGESATRPLTEYRCVCPGGGGYWGRKHHLEGCLMVNALRGVIPPRKKARRD
jgi:hypothetical protein